MNDIQRLYDVVTTLFEKKEKIILLQIGANDGSDNFFMEDPVRDLIKNNDKIFATLVEPQKVEFNNLKKNYEGYEHRVEFINVAISNQNQKVKLYKNTHQNGTTGHSSLLLRQNETNTIFDEQSYEIVDGVTVSELMSNKNPDIDILVIDTEGYDMEIIKQFISEEIYPNVIYFEKPYPLENNDRLGLVQTGDSALYNLLDKLAEIGYNTEILSGNVLCVR